MRFCVLFILGFASFGCKSMSSSDVKIDSGIHIQKTAVNTVPAVFRVTSNGSCTGSAVSTTTVLTAAHCVDGFRNEKVKLCVPGLDICSDKIFAPDNWKGNMGNDIALVVFPQETFKIFMEVTQEKPSIDQGVTMVGYSAHDNPRPELGTKRWGRNKVLDITGINQIHSAFGEESGSVAVSPGDSGGPLLNEHCQIMGVASTMGLGHIKTSQHTGVFFTEDFLNAQQEKGAYVCGLHGQDQLLCPISGRTFVATGLESEDEFPCVYKDYQTLKIPSLEHVLPPLPNVDLDNPDLVRGPAPLNDHPEVHLSETIFNWRDQPALIGVELQVDNQSNDRLGCKGFFGTLIRGPEGDNIDAVTRPISETDGIAPGMKESYRYIFTNRDVPEDWTYMTTFYGSSIECKNLRTNQVVAKFSSPTIVQ